MRNNFAMEEIVENIELAFNDLRSTVSAFNGNYSRNFYISIWEKEKSTLGDLYFLANTHKDMDIDYCITLLDANKERDPILSLVKIGKKYEILNIRKKESLVVNGDLRSVQEIFRTQIVNLYTKH